MKARLSLLAVPFMLGVAFAQSSGSGSPAGSQPDQKSASQPGAAAASGSTSNSAKPAEMKTMTYKGTLVDLGCGSSTQNTASAGSTTDTNAASANRSAGDASASASGSSCAVSANTSQFGLKTDAGQVYRFDMVGNQRAQDEFKNNKHWSSAATANKPLKVKISGVVQGDKIIVSSIH